MINKQRPNRTFLYIKIAQFLIVSLAISLTALILLIL